MNRKYVAREAEEGELIWGEIYFIFNNLQNTPNFLH